MSISNCRRGREIVSPAPSIEVVEQALGQRISSRRGNQRSRTRSESLSHLSLAPHLPCNEDGDTGNPVEEGNNTATSSVQPPSYNELATNNQQSSSSVEW